MQKYLKGDLVKVWALQSFFGGGFIKGRLGRVKQDTNGDHTTVLVIVKRKFDAGGQRVEGIDFSYEVYCKQTEFVRHATEKELENIEYHRKLNETIREYELKTIMKNNVIDEKVARETTPYHYSPEMYFDDDTMLQINKDLLEYPEIFI